MSKRLDHSQVCGRGTGAVGSLFCRLGLAVFFGSLANAQREAAACPSEIQRQIRMRGSLSPCCLSTLCLQLHVRCKG